MAASVYWLKFPCRPRPVASLRGLLFPRTSLALFAAVLIFCCISFTSRLMINLHKNNDNHLDVNDAPTKQMIQISLPKPTRSSVLELHVSNASAKGDHEAADATNYDTTEGIQSQLPEEVPTAPKVDEDDDAPDTSVDNRREDAESRLPEHSLAAPIVEVDDEATDTSDDRREDSDQNQLPEESPVDDDAPDALDDIKEGVGSQFPEESRAGTIVEIVEDARDDNRKEGTQSQLSEESLVSPIVEVDDEATDILDDRREDSDQNQLPEESPVDDDAPDALDDRKERVGSQFPKESLAGTKVEVVEEAHDDNRKEGTQSQLSEESSASPIVDDEALDALDNKREETQSQLTEESSDSPIGNSVDNDNEVYHDNDLFFENYKKMNKSLKIYVYPHSPHDHFANVLLPVTSVPRGNYASESYFKKALMKSHFITKDPSKADFFFLPFSITGMRIDKRIGVGGMQDYVQDYVYNVRQKYPYWNRTGGADHFYVACHSIGKIAMGKAVEVKNNAIQVVCSSNYFVNGYVAHKDVSLPQIWPRHGNPPRVEPSKRKRLAFFAGASNSPPRQYLVKTWRNDSEIFAHAGRLKTPYETEFLRSKFCFHVKGFEVNTARIGDAMYYGCVPVILADHYDLPFGDILNWKSFSVVVETSDIPLMKSILKGIGDEEYLRLQKNVEKARKHFQWHGEPIEYDCFHIVMYELWLRRNYVRVPLS
ncbi:probable glycosyltransferase At5g03795 isoform X1 [Rhododendron vialii]|uniref:probable glycosyltransferase At5g03795 isoform X1 n=1 Tax=Rhododendron vialii TaxID=182163 RepID=UPI00265F9AE5|nr:probable glycosyltransferase At5g03795 isoform X1 [Rhododendron vialii]